MTIQDRAHFVALAGKKMKEVLLDYSKRRNAQKRPEAREREPLTRVVVALNDRSVEMLALTEALESLEKVDAGLAEVV